MQFGVILPQREMFERRELEEFARCASECGYSYLAAYDHVLGADPSARPAWSSRYTHESVFHEVFVLFGYLAALTDLELMTCVLTLPQRQTALVAKQAAQVDRLADGRFRLGVGIGWNRVEFDALGVPWEERAARLEEQIEVLRRLWSEDAVTFGGRFHHIEAAGIKPKPAQARIPIWMGGDTGVTTLRRIGTLSDGWVSYLPPGDRVRDAWALVQEAAVEAGRQVESVGLQGTVRMEPPGGDHIDPPPSGPPSPEELLRQVDAWRELGATHLSVTGIDAGRTPRQHIDLIRSAAELLGLRR